MPWSRVRSKPISAAGLRDNPEVNRRVAAMTALGRPGLRDDIGLIVSRSQELPCRFEIAEKSDVALLRENMNVAWGSRLSNETKGLDVIGIRALDQNIEASLTNGLTTISIRARYISILPWQSANTSWNRVPAAACGMTRMRLLST
jgi:hypothetical protein